MIAAGSPIKQHWDNVYLPAAQKEEHFPPSRWIGLTRFIPANTPNKHQFLGRGETFRCNPLIDDVKKKPVLCFVDVQLIEKMDVL